MIGEQMRKIAAIFLVIIPVVATAQSPVPAGGESYVKKGNFSIFDPSKLTMSHSYSLSYFSGGRQSGSIGYYMNSLEYRFIKPLKIRLDLGYLHSPSGLFSGGSNAVNSGIFVPGVAVDWRPSDNFNFRFDYRQVPIGYYGGHGLNSLFQEDNR